MNRLAGLTLLWVGCTAPAPVSVLAACGRMAAAYCGALDSCHDLTLLRTWGDADTCKTRLSLACQKELAAPSTSLTVARVQACADAQTGCGNLSQSACAAIPGALPLGTQCRFDGQCQSAHCTTTNRAPCGVCTPSAQADDSCAVSCEGDVVCNSTTNQCATLVAAAGPCDGAHPCALGYSCVGLTSTAAGTCQPAATHAGDMCDPMLQKSAGCNFTTNGLFCSSSLSACVEAKYVGNGEACGTTSTTSSRCKAGAFCVNGFCSGPAADGAACNLDTGPSCLWPAYCHTNGGNDPTGTCTLPDASVCASDGIAASPAPTGAFVTAQHDSSLQVPPLGGPVLKAPELYTITFSNYRYRTQVEQFGDWLVGSDWLKTVGGDYGVGAGTHHAVRLPSPAPATLADADWRAELPQLIADGTLPSPGPDTLYMLYIRDADTKYTGNSLGTACSDFGGFHAEIDSGNLSFPFAVVISCTRSGLFSELDHTTSTASHELIEAATDPLTRTKPAFILKQPLSHEGEVGDLCEGHHERDNNFYVQRIWSNRAAASGGDPCAPASTDPYFRIDASPQVIQLSAGESATFTFSAWATAATPAFEAFVEYRAGTFIPLVRDPYRMMNVPLGPGLVTRFAEAPVMVNGQTAQLTLTVPPDAQSGQRATLIVQADISRDVYTDSVFGIVVK
jgi:hypothetical protein